MNEPGFGLRTEAMSMSPAQQEAHRSRIWARIDAETAAAGRLSRPARFRAKEDALMNEAFRVADQAGTTLTEAIEAVELAGGRRETALLLIHQARVLGTNAEGALQFLLNPKQ